MAKNKGEKGGFLEAEAVTNRWLPRNGKPSTGAEKVVHAAIKILAWLPVYTAIVVTLTLLAVLFGLPFLGGGK